MPRMSCNKLSGLRLSCLLPVLALAIPPVLFYALLCRAAIDLPILDDYDAILGFMNHWVTCGTNTEKLSWFLISQHGELKLLFVHIIVLIQYGVFGHLDFRALSLFSEVMIIPLAILLWKMFAPTCDNLPLRLTLFLPVSFLLFQLQYSMELSVATPGIQHIAGLLFSFGAIYFLHRGNAWSFPGAIFCLALSMAADGNGFMMIPIGLFILLRKRRVKDAATFLAVSALCIAVYAYHFDYRVKAVGMDPGPESWWTSVYTHLLYVVGFIGSAGGVNAQFPPGGLFLGCCLLMFFAWKIMSRQVNENAVIYDCALFVVLTAVAAASIRSRFGFAQSLESRYTFYSILCVILAWMVIINGALPQFKRPWDSVFFVVITMGSIVFSLSWDLIGFTAIQHRNQELAAAFVKYEIPTAQDPSPYPVPPYRFPGRNGIAEGIELRVRMRSIMNKSIELGLYHPDFRSALASSDSSLRSPGR